MITVAHMSWTAYMELLVDVVLGSVGTTVATFKADFLRAVVTIDQKDLASQLVNLAQKLNCTMKKQV